MPFSTALSGLKAASEDLRVIGNNVANASTTGYKESRAEFADVFASSTSGASSIGSGVILSAVTQQFSQGQIEFSNNNLDLAVNGEGFFVLSQNGAINYSRSGAFGVDRDGYVTNSLDQRLRGFLADNQGNITGAQGDLQISTSNLSPEATGNIDIKVNLDASAIPPTKAFQTGFTPSTPPDPSTFNTSTSTTIFDSLGNSHIMTTYFVKAPASNTWRAYVGIDDTDVTPTQSTPPGGATPAPYGTTDLAHPFTMVFSPSGALLPNNPAAPPLYYGDGPLNSNASAMVQSGTAATLELNQLIINGVAVDSADTTSDIFSTSDPRGSAISTVAAINASTREHGVTATVNSTVLNIGIPTLGDLAAGDFNINGTQISGVVATDANLLTLINTESPTTGVVATQPGGPGTAITLTAADGRNIQVSTDGVQGSGANFANFDLNLGAGNALNDQTQTGTYSLSTTNNQGLTIAGTNPGSVGLTNGPQIGVIQSSSDTISIPGWNPGGGATTPQLLNIGFGSSSQFGAAFSVQALSQDGFSTGRLSGVNVDDKGIMFARYSNGQSVALGQVALANFGNTQGLSPQGDSAWVETSASGPALIGAPGTADLGLIQAGALESSNVALTDELVSLIVAQRNFQANAQTIRTADAITQTIINIR